MIKNRSSAPQERRQALLTVVFTIISRDLFDAGAPGAHQLPEGQRLCQHRDLCCPRRNPLWG